MKIFFRSNRSLILKILYPILAVNFYLCLNLFTGCSLSSQYISEGLELYDSTYYKEAEAKISSEAIAEDSSSAKHIIISEELRSKLLSVSFSSRGFFPCN